MPKPIHDRIELSIAAIDELMILLASVDAADPLVQPDLRSSECGGDDGNGTQNRSVCSTDIGELALDTSG